MLAKSVARSIDCSFRRIQFTPDLLPTDVTGVNVYNQERGDFEFKPGAVFANVVLADEINRASPKTQSALLESMEERQVTVDTVTYQLGSPFMVIATQNPIEHEGTYPLPAARAAAAAEGRDYVIPDDVKALAGPLLAHRLIVSADAAMSGRTSESILAELLNEVPVPVRGKA